ncbi:MAG: DMT family transporter [Acidobacteria bacterium]|nr:DMT family transporter [Acidobacteriota bacterium]
MSADRATGAALAAAGALSFGTTVALSRALARAGLPPSGVLGIRFGVAAILLWVLLAAARRPLAPAPGERLAAFALGAVLYAVEATFFYLALRRGSAAAVALLFYSYPAMVTVAEAIAGARGIGRRTIGALALSTLGAALVVGPGDRLAISGAGVGFAMAAALTFAVYLMAGARLTARSDPRASAAMVAAGTAASNLVWAALVSRAGVPLRFLPLVVANGLATAAAFALVFAALRRLRAADTSVILTLEALWAGLMAWIFLGEAVGPLQAAGGAAILSAAVLIATRPPQTPSATERGAADAP